MEENIEYWKKMVEDREEDLKLEKERHDEDRELIKVITVALKYARAKIKTYGI